MMIGEGSEKKRRMNVYKRETLVAMLQAALENSEYRFARQAALAWLAAFPGDMEVTLLQARAVIAEGKPSQVIAALDLVCRKDPLYLDGYRLLAWASRDLDENRCTRARTCAYILGDRAAEGARIDAWGDPLRAAYLSYLSRQFGDALVQIEEVLRLYPDHLLAHTIHLLILRAVKTPAEVSRTAEKYHAQWPDCLPISLTLAEAYLETGKEPDAVRLLHMGAAGDTVGQVAVRLWGENHAYRSLWPEDLVILFDQPIPAGVAGSLGWNRLAAGEAHPQPEEIKLPQVDPLVEQQTGGDQPLENDPFMEVLEAFRKKKAQDTSPKNEEMIPAEQTLPELEQANNQIEQEVIADPDLPIDLLSEVDFPVTETSSLNNEQVQVKQKVERELERLAKNLKQASLARSDGRYPVYVILSARAGLENQFGPQTAAVIDNELRRLVGLVGQRKKWQAMLIYPDHAGSVGQYGLTPIEAGDPWKVKHFLADLDRALEKRGEMIGALLIVGGDSVLPFHRLPNPTEDSDTEIISDSPYATMDANYFVPEWPVGRLPGEKGSDAGALLEQIRQVQHFHSRRVKPNQIPVLGLFYWIKSLVERCLPTRKNHSFGYTAAVWRRSSLAVFRPIGAPHTVVASPPVYSGKLDPRRIMGSNLGYYNLHGLEDSPSWYGQRDPLEKGGAPDYPVAISPDDLHKNGRSPKFIFSEACYGGHIFGKSEKDSLALKFLSMGALGVVASTSISYGSISTPLIAADLLGHMFWQHMKAGYTAGEALMQAKVGLVREMNRRQGYLDGEDQKTIISFVLFGDPLGSYDGFRLLSKATHRYKDHPMIPTTVDENQEVLSPGKVPADVLRGVKQVVSEYLPGADVAGIHFCRLHWAGNQEAGQPGQKVKEQQAGRMVVTVSKQVVVAQHTHRHYLRVTMDDTGKPVKVALSR